VRRGTLRSFAFAFSLANALTRPPARGLCLGATSSATRAPGTWVADGGGGRISSAGTARRYTKIPIELAIGLNAVECAVALQCRMADANGALPAERRIELRVGINLGDVVVEGGDLFGDGVNVAARLQEVAEPGGICVAASVRDQVRAKVALEFDDLGERQLKNIAVPVRVYRNASTAVPMPLIEKPSIAVLPFENLSGDPEQQYFSDGITEDIVTKLSRFRSLSVIARISSLAFKTKSIKVRDVARDLGVAYVVEGRRLPAPYEQWSSTPPARGRMRTQHGACSSTTWPVGRPIARMRSPRRINSRSRQSSSTRPTASHP
jgi:class 3 adenylate cyclase